MSVTEKEAAVELGSRWYAWGHHWEVTGFATRDGEPAVKLKRTDNPPKRGYNEPTVITRLLERHGRAT